MPHLPPPRIIGSSVKIRIPVSEVNDNEEMCGEPLFKKRPECIIEAFPPDSNKKYAFEQYSATDKRAQIYKIEIYGEDEDEVFEFRPKDGKCTVEVYYAVSNELPLRHVNEWLEPGEELCQESSHKHEHE